MTAATPDDAAGLVAARDRDRWLASQFLPADVRGHVLALYAFSAEIAGIRDHISQPLPGEIRLQWWREALTGAARGDTAAHPVAAALAQAITACHLPVAPLLALIDARVFDLYDDPMPSLNDLEGYLGETSSALFQLAAMIAGTGAGAPEAAGHAGCAYGLTGLMRALGPAARRGQCFLPADRLAAHGATVEDIVHHRATPGVLATLAELRARARFHLDAAQQALRAAPAVVRTAFLPLALVAPNLKALEISAQRPFAPRLGIPDWRRPLTLWWAARRL